MCILCVLFQYYEVQVQPLDPFIVTNQLNINKTLMLNKNINK
jgi:hypothetical protein